MPINPVGVSQKSFDWPQRTNLFRTGAYVREFKRLRGRTYWHTGSDTFIDYLKLPKLHEVENYFKPIPTVVSVTRPVTVGFNSQKNTPHRKEYLGVFQKGPKNSEFLEDRGGSREVDDLMFFIDYPDLSIRTYCEDLRTYVRVGLLWDLYAGTVQYRKSEMGPWGARRAWYKKWRKFISLDAMHAVNREYYLSKIKIKYPTPESHPVKDKLLGVVTGSESLGRKEKDIVTSGLEKRTLPNVEKKSTSALQTGKPDSRAIKSDSPTTPEKQKIAGQSTSGQQETTPTVAHQFYNATQPFNYEKNVELGGSKSKVGAGEAASFVTSGKQKPAAVATPLKQPTKTNYTHTAKTRPTLGGLSKASSWLQKTLSPPSSISRGLLNNYDEVVIINKNQRCGIKDRSNFMLEDSTLFKKLKTPLCKISNTTTYGLKSSSDKSGP